MVTLKVEAERNWVEQSRGLGGSGRFLSSIQKSNRERSKSCCKPDFCDTSKFKAQFYIENVPTRDAHL